MTSPVHDLLAVEDQRLIRVGLEVPALQLVEHWRDHPVHVAEFDDRAGQAEEALVGVLEARTEAGVSHLVHVETVLHGTILRRAQGHADSHFAAELTPQSRADGERTKTTAHCGRRRSGRDQRSRPYFEAALPPVRAVRTPRSA
jgi:hypothetical protein